jgi:hypothetical protein
VNSLRRLPNQNSKGDCTGQTGERHRSDRCDLSSRDEKHPQVNSPKSNSDLLYLSTDLCKTLGIVGTPYGCSIAKIWSTKTC